MTTTLLCDQIGTFYEGLAWARLGSDYFHVRESGKRAYPESYTSAGHFLQGKASVRKSDGRIVQIDHNGIEVAS